MDPTSARVPLTADDLAPLLRPRGPLARAELVAVAGSTNVDLASGLRSDPDVWPSPSLLVADHQADGRGRTGRSWQTPPRAALTMSMAFALDVPPGTAGWLPLLAGLATVAAVREVAGVPAVLKWPNDVLVPAPDGVPLDGWGARRKVAGILAEMVVVPGRPAAAVVGIGLNVSQQGDELPVPSAASLADAPGGPPDRASLLVAVVTGLVSAVGRWQATGGDAVAAGLADEVAGVCATLGDEVAVELPGGEVVTGRASALRSDGALVVDTPQGPRVVLAGDVHHVRRGR